MTGAGTQTAGKGANRNFAGLRVARLTIGEVRSSRRPMHLKTLLGSCVAVCLYDPVGCVGGMNHISLPGSSAGQDCRFGVHAMELLINQLMAMGSQRHNLVAKCFGGAEILRCIRTPVGKGNASFVRDFLADEGIPLVGQRLGGSAAVDVSFRTDTGYVLLRTLLRSAVEEAERKLKADWLAGKHVATAEDPVLF